VAPDRITGVKRDFIMKLRIGIFAILMSLATQAFAGKTVVLDLQRAIAATDYAKNEAAALQKKPEFVKLRAELESHSAELQSLEEKAKNEGLTWSNEQRIEHNKQREYVVADFQLARQKLQKEQETVMQQVFAEAQKHVADVIENLVKAEDIDLILRADAVWHGEPEVDITSKFVAELNKVLK
jgi:outer membrane protein